MPKMRFYGDSNEIRTWSIPCVAKMTENIIHFVIVQLSTRDKNGENYNKMKVIRKHLTVENCMKILQIKWENRCTQIISWDAKIII